MNKDEYNSWFLKVISLRLLLDLKYSIDGKSLKFLSQHVNQVMSSYNVQVVYVDEGKFQYLLGIKKNIHVTDVKEYEQVVVENLESINKFIKEAENFIESEGRRIFE